MSIEDFRLAGATSFDADLCLIGSGPAAYAIASQLRGTALRIIVLESGGVEPEADSTELNRIEQIGAPYLNWRDRIVGGTSETWSGRCVDFSRIDYASRSWVPHSGWPIGPETLAPYLNNAAQCLGANPFDPDGREWEPGAIDAWPDFDERYVMQTTWQVATPVRFGAFFRSRNGNLRVLSHATVTHIDTDPSDGHVTSVEIASAYDRRATVTARAFVLCAGGNENARVLLYSNRTVPAGVGNQHDLVGRFFMDHPRDRSKLVKFELRDERALRRLLGPFNFDNAYGQCDFLRGFELGEETQRREGLLNCAAWGVLDVAEDDPIQALRRVYYGAREHAVRDLSYMAINTYAMARGLIEGLTTQRRMGQKFERIGLVIASEQIPDPESRITLGEKRDRLGLPAGVLDWRLHEREMVSQGRLAELIGREFERLGLPRATLADWVKTKRYDEAIAAQVDGCHPTGTTRMAASPRAGVVDADCQVHGVAGLYVAGSSVFPTAGHANPTLMIVALALRLARHLEKQLTAIPELAKPEPANAKLTNAELTNERPANAESPNEIFTNAELANGEPADAESVSIVDTIWFNEETGMFETTLRETAVARIDHGTTGTAASSNGTKDRGAGSNAATNNAGSVNGWSTLDAHFNATPRASARSESRPGRSEPGVSNRMETAAITGATGFIGSRLVEFLIAEGVEVTCLLRSTNVPSRLHESGATPRMIDLLDRQALTNALAGIDVAYHCAYDWDDPTWNLDAMDALIAACVANRTRLVFLSSFVVYGGPTVGLITETCAAGTATEGYACVKSELEGKVLHAVREAGLIATILQPTIVYGPHSRPWTIEPVETLRRRTFVLPDRGRGICNAVYVDDVVAAMLLAAKKPHLSGERFLISGPPVTWAEFYGAMARAAGVPGPIFQPAYAIARETGRVRRMLRAATDPQRVARKFAATGPGRLIAGGSAKLGTAATREPAAASAARIASRRRPLEFPDLGRLGFFRYRATIDSAKARALLGYNPAYDFATGMIPTAAFIEREMGETAGVSAATGTPDSTATASTPETTTPTPTA